MDLQPIAWVYSPAKTAVDEGWGRIVSEIRIRPELAAGLLGLETFSHAVVVFLMHQATFDLTGHRTRRPRDRADMPLVGIFAQRSRHRPNPLGVSTVAIERVANSSLFVRGLDAIDGTPVLDIKPHVQAFDSPPSAVEPEWMSQLMEEYF
jgi:tRNA-Thr(GGU) m(6)t(6)A37 methyltransferase TsaA